MKVGFDESKVLILDEKILLKDDVKNGIYPVGEIIALLFVFIASIMGDGFLIGSSVVKSLIDNSGFLSAIIFMFALIIHTASIMAWGIWLLKRIQENKSLWIVITDNRVIKAYDKKVFETKAINLCDITKIVERKGKIALYIADECFSFRISNSSNAVEIICKLINK